MNKKELCDLIKKAFGKYTRPNIISGHPREPWMDRMEKVPLEQLTSEEMYLAVCHVFPGHYGDKNVFCYMLNRTLLYFICDTDELWADEIKINTGEHCVQWKTKLSPQEIDVITFVFEYASFKDYYSSGSISPFYFTLFLCDYSDSD
jgi:hypothetical protein